MAVNKCIKYLLFLFNLLFWISGCIILGVSIYLKVSKDQNKITNFAIPGIDLLIAIGVFIMVLGFLGCCGAIRENRCMLLLFFIGLLLIFTLLLTAGILGTVGEDKTKSWIKQKLEKLMPLDKHPEIHTDLENFQKKAKCCGLVNGPTDWSAMASKLPPSCNCEDKSQACTTVDSKSVYSTPCINAVTSFIKNHLTIVLGVAFAIALLLIFGMAFSLTLYCQIGKDSMSTAA
ncbi:tetraspanin-8-like [Denticeps clupeoides]|uniref:Tetraspanin n=1 Tax=Denticeps clupeoides TaxID=299321 RepID=A0AAY4BQG9_9TELE|nr:tetraspanin-8 [Denticeps clupeoides]